MASYAAKDAGGEKINLTAIEARLAELEAAVVVLETANSDSRLSSLETQLTDRKLIGAAKYDGTYTFTISESRFRQCQNKSIWGIIGEGGNPYENMNFYAYFAAAESSTVSSGGSIFDATSLDGTLSIPPFDIRRQGFNAMGAIGYGYESAGGIEASVSPDGTIYQASGPEEFLVGQFSADGSTFTIHVYNNPVPVPPETFFCGGGTEINMYSMVGVRK